MTATTVNKKQATDWVGKGVKADPEAMKEKLNKFKEMLE